MAGAWLLAAALAAGAALGASASQFLVVLTCHAGFESRVAAGRASRLAQGLQTVVVTNELAPERRHLRQAANETWVLHDAAPFNTSESSNPVRHLEDLAAFTAYEALAPAFDWPWVFVGEDDSLFFRRGAETAVREADSAMPYVIADAAWFVSHEGQRHYLKAEAPRCVPCGYTGDLARLPPHMQLAKGCPCAVSGELPSGNCGPIKMPSMDTNIAHGGPGYLLSLGFLMQVSLQRMQQCLKSGEGQDLYSCLWKLGIGITDPDPVWHPEGLTHFDPCPGPFLTHDNVLEKLAHSLGNLMRAAAGMCEDVCKAEVAHLTSLHVNAVRIGYTQEGEKRVGNFQDPGEREVCGLALLAAASRYVAAQQAGGGGAEAWAPGANDRLGKKADKRLAAAARMIASMGALFQEDVLGEGVRATQPGNGTAGRLSAMERARSAVAASVVRQALDIVLQDCTGGTAI